MNSLKMVNYSADLNHPLIGLRNYDYKNTDDLYVIEIGYGKHDLEFKKTLCRNLYVLHYVESGDIIFNGTLVHEGQGYLMMPNEVNVLTSPKTNGEAQVYWIMFNGNAVSPFLKKCGIAEKNHIYNLKGNSAATRLLKKALIKKYSKVDLSFSLISLLFEIGAIHKKENCVHTDEDKSNTLVSLAKEFINTNYSSAFTIGDVADFINISQNHLCKLFKKESGCSIQDYVINVRMNAAKSLLRNSYLNIGGIADAVGFKSSVYFSQAFKTYVGISPKDYRQKKRKKK